MRLTSPLCPRPGLPPDAGASVFLVGGVTGEQYAAGLAAGARRRPRVLVLAFAPPSSPSPASAIAAISLPRARPQSNKTPAWRAVFHQPFPEHATPSHA